MHACPRCETSMESKGEISENASIIFYQCPKCKNIELLTVQCHSDLRMSYP